MRLTDRERFERKYVIQAGPNETPCHVWQGSKIPGGYGHFRFSGKPQAAHRVSYELNIGPIPEGKIVRHTCHNPACVNPEHLCLGSHDDNMGDMARSGRARVLDRDDVVLALEMLKQHSQTAVAAFFGVDRTTIQRVIKNAQAGDYGSDLVVSLGDKPHRFLTEAQRKEAIDLLRSGVRVTTVAKRFGVDRKTVRNLRPSDIPSPPNGRPRADV